MLHWMNPTIILELLTSYWWLCYFDHIDFFFFLPTLNCRLKSGFIMWAHSIFLSWVSRRWRRGASESGQHLLKYGGLSSMRYFYFAYLLYLFEGFSQEEILVKNALLLMAIWAFTIIKENKSRYILTTPALHESHFLLYPFSEKKIRKAICSVSIFQKLWVIITGSTELKTLMPLKNTSLNVEFQGIRQKSSSCFHL